MGDIGNLIQIRKFNGANFPLWKFQINCALKAKVLPSFVVDLIRIITIQKQIFIIKVMSFTQKQMFQKKLEIWSGQWIVVLQIICVQTEILFPH